MMMNLVRVVPLGILKKNVDIQRKARSMRIGILKIHSRLNRILLEHEARMNQKHVVMKPRNRRSGRILRKPRNLLWLLVSLPRRVHLFQSREPLSQSLAEGLPSSIFSQAMMSLKFARTSRLMLKTPTLANLLRFPVPLPTILPTMKPTYQRATTQKSRLFTSSLITDVCIGHRNC